MSLKDVVFRSNQWRGWRDDHQGVFRERIQSLPQVSLLCISHSVSHPSSGCIPPDVSLSEALSSDDHIFADCVLTSKIRHLTDCWKIKKESNAHLWIEISVTVLHLKRLFQDDYNELIMFLTSCYFTGLKDQRSMNAHCSSSYSSSGSGCMSCFELVYSVVMTNL